MEIVFRGPGTATFGDASQTNTTATFTAAGVYTLELSADDGVHAVAYNAVVITGDQCHQCFHPAQRNECHG